MTPVALVGLGRAALLPPPCCFSVIFQPRGADSYTNSRWMRFRALTVELQCASFGRTGAVPVVARYSLKALERPQQAPQQRQRLNRPRLVLGAIGRPQFASARPAAVCFFQSGASLFTVFMPASSRTAAKYWSVAFTTGRWS